MLNLRQFRRFCERGSTFRQAIQHPRISRNCTLNENRQSTNRKTEVTPWCNGNTAPFGGVILGSNPSGVATLSTGNLPMKLALLLNAQRNALKRTKNTVYLTSIRQQEFGILSVIWPHARAETNNARPSGERCVKRRG